MSTTINLNPTGLNITGTKFLYLTNSGVLRYPDGGKESKPEYAGLKTAKNASSYGNCLKIIDIVDDKYISLKAYTANAVNRVEDYKESKGYVFNHVEAEHYWKGRKFNVEGEIRIYKDRKFVKVFRIWNDHEEKFFVINPAIIKDKFTYYFDMMICEFPEEVDSFEHPKFKEWLETKSRTGRVDTYNNELGHWETTYKAEHTKYIEVHSDEEIQNNATICINRNTASPLVSVLGVSVLGPIMTKEQFESATAIDFNEIGKFSEEFAGKVNEFMGVKSKENEDAKAIFDKKYQWSPDMSCGYGRMREPKQGIHAYWSLVCWCRVNPSSNKAAKTKLEKAKGLFKTVKFNDPVDSNRTITWARKDGMIIAAMYIPETNTEELERHEQKVILTYDLKTKVRMLAEKTKSGVTVSIPTVSKINDLFPVCNSIEQLWNVEKRKYENKYCRGADVFIEDGLTVRELFDGTNVAWILDNYEDMSDKVIVSEAGISRYYTTSHNHYKSLKSCFNKDSLGSLALQVLVTTGDKLCEQLLKSKLFTLYFANLSDKANMCGGSSSDRAFADKTKATARYARLTYDAKGSNLKKMLGFNMEQLRLINQMTYDKTADRIEYIAEQKKKGERCYGCGYYYEVPAISRVFDFLMLEGEEVQHLDMKTFNRCIAMGDAITRYDRGLRGEIAVWFKALPVKQKLDIVEKYMYVSAEHSSYSNATMEVEDISDYFRMRQQLSDLKKTRPEIEYNDDSYPITPGKAVKFLHFVPGYGYRTSSRWGGTRYITGEHFNEDYLSQEFNVDKKDVEMCYDPEGELCGALIRMTPRAHLKYLHNEISGWFELYQDEAKQEAFDKAMERVLPLEWSDEETGLSIIAPKSPRDVCNEGHVLSHCVASYVDPIINGSENIMFIRRTDMIDHPYFTLDITNDGKVRQVHCYRNGNPTNSDIEKAFANSGYVVYDKPFDINKFLLKWCKAMKGKVDKHTIVPHYGALCAIR